QHARAFDLEVDARDVLALLDDVERELAVVAAALDRLVEPVLVLKLGRDLAGALPLLDHAEAALALDPDLALEVVAPAARGDDDVPPRARLVEHGVARAFAAMKILRITVDVLDERSVAGEREAGPEERGGGGDESDRAHGSSLFSAFGMETFPMKTAERSPR